MSQEMNVYGRTDRLAMGGLVASCNSAGGLSGTYMGIN